MGLMSFKSSSQAHSGDWPIVLICDGRKLLLGSKPQRASYSTLYPEMPNAQVGEATVCNRRRI